MNDTDRWREYRAQQLEVSRGFARWIALAALLIAPWSFVHDLQLLRDPNVPRLQAHGLLAIHGYMVLTTLLFAALLHRSNRRPTDPRRSTALLTFGIVNTMLTSAAIGSINQLGSGSVIGFAGVVAFMTVVSFMPARAFVAWVAGGAAMILIAIEALQGSAALAAGARLNTLSVTITTAVLYPSYERWRFREHQRRKALETALDTSGTLMRALSHDLRTPLVGIRRIARLLDDDVPLTRADQHAWAAELDALTHRFLLVLDNLMALERRGSPSDASPRGPASLADVFDRVADRCQHDAERKSITVTIDLEDDVLVAVEREVLVTILDNLLGNALKFTPRHGRVAIATTIGPERIEVAVHDGGTGIAPEGLARLRRGERIPPSAGTEGEQGMGIGLGVVRSLLAPLGSPLDLEAGAGGGTTVRFTLPRFKGAV